MLFKISWRGAHVPLEYISNLRFYLSGAVLGSFKPALFP